MRQMMPNGPLVASTYGGHAICHARNTRAMVWFHMCAREASTSKQRHDESEGKLAHDICFTYFLIIYLVKSIIITLFYYKAAASSTCCDLGVGHRNAIK